MAKDEPCGASAEEILERCMEYADCIYVREEINGAWRSVSLAELPVARALWHVIQFVRSRSEAANPL